MTYNARIGDSLHALWRQNVQNALTGSYVESGLDASPGSSGSSIQVDVDPGDARINDSPVSVAGDTLTFDAVGVSDEYRADVIYATTSGGLAVEKGNSAPPEPTISGNPYPTGSPQPARRLFAPSPPDGSAINGLPIHVVLVADTTSDSNDLALEDLVDYRIAPPLPGDHDHPEFAFNRRTEYLKNTDSDQYVKLATVNDGTSAAHGAVRLVGVMGNKRGIETPRRFDVGIITGGSNYGVDAFAYGSRAGATDIIVTEEPASQAGTPENRYHCYAFVPSNSGTYLAMVHNRGLFGGYQYIENLSQNDLIGNVVWDTGGSTGGPGGETEVPKTSSQVRGDVEGSSDVADLVSGDAGGADRVPVSQSNGSVGWSQRVPSNNEWVPLISVNYASGDAGYSTTSSGFEAVTGKRSSVVIPYDAVQSGRFSETGVSLSATIRSGSDGATMRIQLAESAGGSGLSDTRLLRDQDTVAAKTSDIEAVSLLPTEPIYLQMQTDSSNAAEAYMPTVTVWGRSQ
jgi:hypothetical protein